MDKLFCKPQDSGIIFKKYIHELQAPVRFRSLDIYSDISLINEWVNKAYAKRFWQLDGQGRNLSTIYDAVLRNPGAHSFIGLIDEEPFCQVDVYVVAIDELVEHVEAKPCDAGLHLLLCPPREMRKGWSYYALKCFQQFFFSFDTDADLYAEPDHGNYHANRLAINCGMQFLKTVTLSYKTANVYRMTKEQFLVRG